VKSKIKKGSEVRAAKEMWAESRCQIRKGCRGRVLGWIEHSWKVRWYGHKSMPIGWHNDEALILDRDWKKKPKDRAQMVTSYFTVRELIEALEQLPDDRLPVIHPVGIDWSLLQEAPRPILIEPVTGTCYYRPAKKKTKTMVAVAIGLREDD